MSKNHFKNSFAEQPPPKPEGRLIEENMSTVVSNKLADVVELYRRSTADNGYDQWLAYRVLVMTLINKFSSHFNLVEEVHRFFKFCLKEGSLDHIQMCFDLMLLKEFAYCVPKQDVRLLKARVLKALQACYVGSEKKKDRKKCGYTLEEYCKDALNKEDVKRHPEVYSEILDILIEQTKRKIANLIKGSKHIQACEMLTAFAVFLEKSDLIVTGKYQKQLLEVYWSLAQLHDKMHYLAHTKKYGGMALNIAKRIEDKAATRQLTELLERNL